MMFCLGSRQARSLTSDMMLSVAIRVEVGHNPLLVGAVKGFDVKVELDNSQIWVGRYNVELTAASSDAPAISNMVSASSRIYCC